MVLFKVGFVHDRAFTEPRDNVLLLTPIYYPFYTVIARNKRTLVESTVQLKRWTL